MTRSFLRLFLAPLFALALTAAAQVRADGLQALEAFLREARSGRAEFTQVVTSPAREGETARSKTSSGSFAFQRPDRFRFDYKKPFEQTLVADGETLWLYDADLNQVTARGQAQALGSTPAAIVTSAPDLQALRQHFQLQAAPARDGLQWVQATPRDKEGQVSRVLLGLRGTRLERLEIQDALGQRSVITFHDMELNPALPPETFRFRAPAGAAVIRQ
ncbi:outer membrane lipoprotein chaperone LolA [Ramlibacter sp. AW1]|uniref:Outer-membrane lipoprotein carrier protein n=1 Tax=Ramlibacter aurantiacus TaxID=2801330 RepID=A0A937D7H1_9BURK|nr:outer membrane lipoprotein chaperone LolA [Ramlibacter aurantiacus]MBL0420936.1 outer membrane lipoprotein chaperone LolA [Ramlibacter aurantiacus]